MSEDYQDEEMGNGRPTPPDPPIQRSTGFENDFQPTEAQGLPMIRISGSSVILENGAELPTDYCVKSGRPAVYVIEKALRNPMNPLTWFGRRYRVAVGLSKQQHENRLIFIALTWSVLAIGIVLLSCGVYSLSIPFIAIGSLLVLGSGIFRAIFPVWSSQVFEDYIEIQATGEAYRRRLIESGLAAEIDQPAEQENSD